MTDPAVCRTCGNTGWDNLAADYCTCPHGQQLRDDDEKHQERRWNAE